ncbi:MAG: SBBP repeat-containing protein, partial [Ignavibacteria bacterium]
MKSIFIFLIMLSVTILKAQTQEWAAVYNGTGNTNDQSYDIITDAFGNVIIAGRSVLSTPTSNFCTVKYNPAGVQQWAVIYNGPSNDYDQPVGLVSDVSGNIYVAGMSLNTLTGYDIVLIKYNASGIQQWVQTWSNAGNRSDFPNSITIDASGNIYITGESEVPANINYITLKYNSGGVLQWAKQFSSGISRRVEVDATGNVYVTGQGEYTTSGSDFLTIKYNSAGDTLWTRRYGTADLNERPTGFALDVNGNCYITGTATPGSPYGFLTVKYNAAGVFQWSAYNDSARTPADVEVDALGNVYVTGSTIVGSSTSIATIKFNSSGIRQWISIYDYLPEALEDNVNDLELDAAGNVYITGSSQIENGTNRDVLTVKYDNAGNEKWVARYDVGNSEEAFKLNLDAEGNVIVTGYRTLNANADFLTIKYSQTVGIHQISNHIPGQYSLEQNYPNPFNPVTNFEFGISNLGFVSLIVYDVR